MHVLCEPIFLSGHGSSFNKIEIIKRRSQWYASIGQSAAHHRINKLVHIIKVRGLPIFDDDDGVLISHSLSLRSICLLLVDDDHDDDAAEAPLMAKRIQDRFFAIRYNKQASTHPPRLSAPSQPSTQTPPSSSSSSMSLFRRPFYFLVDRPKVSASVGAAVLAGLPFANAACLGASSALLLSFLNVAGTYCTTLTRRTNCACTVISLPQSHPGRLLNRPPSFSLASLLGFLSLSLFSPFLFLIITMQAFGINVATVSVPGRLDGRQDAAMRSGDLNPSESTPLTTDSASAAADAYNASRTRSLVNPAGWAFAIWGPIYLGEAALCASTFVPGFAAASELLPQMTAPFVAANLFQSLWCATFRPEAVNGTWTSFISPFMLAGTAYSLSQINTIAGGHWLLLLPLTMHFGWTTAATLVNLNGSLTSFVESDRTMTAAGHASALVATALGVGFTVLHGTPAYGLTVAWALAACADSIGKRPANELTTGRRVQKYLCWSGAGACAATAVYSMVL